MVLAIALRKYEPAALSRLFRFTLAAVQAEHRSDREVTMWPTPLGVFPNGQFDVVSGHVRGNRQRREAAQLLKNAAISQRCPVSA